MESYFGWIKYNSTKSELTYNLNRHLKKVLSEFSYLRYEGLVKLLELLKSFNDENIAIFLALQDSQTKNLTYYLFSHILNSKELKSHSPITVQEKQKALEILQGVFLLHPASKLTVVEDNNGIKVLLDLLEVPQLQLSVLETFLTLLVDEQKTQKAFTQQKGIAKILQIATQKTTWKEVRAKCGEFLSFAIRYFVHDNDEIKQQLIDYWNLNTPEIVALLAQKVEQHE